MKVGIIGCGFIGSMLAKECDDIEEVEKVRLYDVDVGRGRHLASKVSKAELSGSGEELIELSDLIVEAASHGAVHEYGSAVLERDKDLMVMSIGAFNDDQLYERISALARERSGHLYLPSGAIAGVDGLKSATVANVESVELKTIKPVTGFDGVDYIHEQGLNLHGLTEKKVVFEGSAREAAKHFPKNINVAAGLSLAGIGFDRTTVKIVADPSATTNHHNVTVRGRFGSFTVNLKNYPAVSNPKTSYLAALSAIATLRNIVTGVWIGT